jgi:hypothetical protein
MIHITRHAIERYRERVEPVDEGTALARLRSPVISKAVAFGCGSVKLPGGQRVVIEDGCVVTVLPRKRPCRRRYGRPARFSREEG